MTARPAPTGPDDPGPAAPPPARSTAHALLRLARPQQWAKGFFVMIGPLYALTDRQEVAWPAVIAAFLAFNLAASGCYVVNDLRDVEQDRAHPRKRRRPIASGQVAPRTAASFAAALFAGAAACVGAAFLTGTTLAASLLAATVALYVLNVTLYSLRLKRIVILDVVSLAAGFVLRVLGGCAAAGVSPSTWLINCTFFLSMFLAFGKRLGERRTMGEQGRPADTARSVQSVYTDDILRMVVVMTAVATLVLYAGYIQAREDKYTEGFNLLWLTVLPATYALLRTILLVESGRYDDPTELAVHDRPFQAAAALFGLLTVGVLVVVEIMRRGSIDAPTIIP